ncbi:MAG: transposase [Candidatus Nanopelagicales bacterium]
MYPSETQHETLLSHCASARFVWNLAVEQQSYYSRTRPWAPSHLARSKQLTEARATFGWLRVGSVIVQQQALRDFDQAMRNFFGGTHRLPTFRKRGLNEGFRIVATGPADVRQLNRRWSEVKVPKIGWVRFRRTRAVGDFKSYRVTLDRAGRWHVSFAQIPDPIPSPETGEIIGVDRGVVHVATLSDGTFYDYARPDLNARVKRLQRKLARCKRGSNRRASVKAQLGRAQARRADARKDFIEKTTTDIAARYDVIRLENLKVRNMTRSAKGTIEAPGVNVRAKAGLNRSILDKVWGMFAQRLEHKARGRVEYVPAAYTSQRCSGCGVIASESRKSQADFCCVACGYTDNADCNAAKNVAAGGQPVTARGGTPLGEPVNREPQRDLLLV